MNTFTKLAFAAMAITASFTASAQDRADLLFIVGDATPGGWSLDDATALVSNNDPNVYQGTLYLTADKEFKFLTTYDWGNNEYHPSEGAKVLPGEDGIVKIALNGDDNKITVAESANYLVTVNLNTLEASITKSVYQDTEIKYASLFAVGDALPTTWDVNKGLVLYQNPETPYVYSRAGFELSTGVFKIATCLKGAGTWAAKYWYFADVNDPAKMALGQDGDNKWNVAEVGTYDLTANTLTNDIELKKVGDNGTLANLTLNGVASAAATYYDLQGARVLNPAKGQIVVRVDANGKASKVRF